MKTVKREPEREFCIECGEATERCGEGEDSLYCSTCYKGPFCTSCYEDHELACFWGT